MIKLLFYRGKGNFFDKLIRFFTKSKYSHCELCVGDYCYSSSPRDGGVRRKYIIIDPTKWDSVIVPNEHLDNIEKLFTETVGKKYDWLGVLSIVFPFIPQSYSRWFCSEWCAKALNLPCPHLYTPGSLARSFGVKDDVK